MFTPTKQHVYNSQTIYLKISTQKYFDFDWFYFTDYLLVYCFTSLTLQCLPKTLYNVVQMLLNQYTGAKIVILSAPAKQSMKNTAEDALRLEAQSLHWAFQCAWSDSLILLGGTCPYCFCVAFCYCRTLWCLSSTILLLQGHEDVSFYKAIPAWWCRSRVLLWHCP